MKPRKKRKYVRRTGKRALVLVSRIRTRNNRLWMQLLAVALEARPTVTKKILAKITENDLEVSKWLSRV